MNLFLHFRDRQEFSLASSNTNFYRVARTRTESDEGGGDQKVQLKMSDYTNYTKLSICVYFTHILSLYSTLEMNNTKPELAY